MIKSEEQLASNDPAGFYKASGSVPGCQKKYERVTEICTGGRCNLRVQYFYPRCHIEMTCERIA